MKSLPNVGALVALMVCALSAVACGGIRVVRVTPSGGVLALQGDQTKARQKAEDYMASRCTNGYDILEEGEAVVGQTTSGSANTYGSGGRRYGSSFTTMSSSSQDVREWRVTYQCKGAAPEAPPAAATPGAPANPPTTSKGEIETVVVRF